jgi:hypothetical protein
MPLSDQLSRPLRQVRNEPKTRTGVAMIWSSVGCTGGIRSQAGDPEAAG